MPCAEATQRETLEQLRVMTKEGKASKKIRFVQQSMVTVVTTF